MPTQKTGKIVPDDTKRSRIRNKIVPDLPKYVQARPDGWYVRRNFPAGRDDNGRIRYIQVVRKLDEQTSERAAAISDAIERAYHKATHFPEPTSDVLSIAKEYVAAKKNAVSAKTHSSYKWMLRYLSGPFGQRDATKLTPRDIQRFYESLLDGGTSPKMVRKIHSYLSSCFKQAQRWQVLSHNPTEGVVLPKKADTHVEAMDEDEAKRFAAVCREKYPMLLLALETGMRPGEYCALRWSDVKKDSIHVRRSVSFTDGVHYVPTKTRSGVRTITISSQLSEVLSSLPRTNELVFPNQSGGPFDPKNISNRQMAEACTEAKIKKYSLYSLRHTSAALLLLAGVDAKTVSERLGHRDVAFTLQQYAYVLKSMGDSAAEKLSGVLYEK